MRRLPATLLSVVLVTACGSTAQLGSTGTPQAGDGLSAPGLDPLDSSTQGTGPAPETTTPGGGLPAVSGPGQAAPGQVDTAPGVRGAAPATTSVAKAGALTGTGFDRDSVSFGVEFIDGGDAFLKNAGFSSLSTGDARALIDTMVKDINARGGVLGRRLVPVYKATDAAAGSSDPQGTAQAVCTYFTQDRKVAAATIVSPADACMAAKRVPHTFTTTQVVDDASLRTSAPWSRRPLALSFNRLSPVLVDRLTAKGFLTPASRIGVLYPDTPTGRRVFADLQRRLAARGLDVAADYAYAAGSATASASNVPNAVLPFRSAGVDRVIGTDATTAYFMTAAEQQGYRPKYALNSYMNLASVMESVPPPAQLDGAVGVGWLPPNDVAESRIDVRPPGFGSCQEHIRRSGQKPTGFALVVLTSYCDSLRLFVYAAEQGGGLDAESIRRGLAAKGASFPSALVLESAFSETRMDGARAVRDIAYVADCSCFRYTGPSRPGA